MLSFLWAYVDEEKLGPPVDYHEVRGHLRVGTVIVNDDNLRRKLRAGLPVTPVEDIAIRGAVFDAIMMISELSGIKNPSPLHYLFWNVFRSSQTSVVLADLALISNIFLFRAMKLGRYRIAIVFGIMFIAVLIASPISDKI